MVNNVENIVVLLPLQQKCGSHFVEKQQLNILNFEEIFEDKAFKDTAVNRTCQSFDGGADSFGVLSRFTVYFCMHVLYNLLYNSCLSRFGPSNESEFKVRLVYLGGVEGLAERSRACRFLISPGYIWFPPRILPAGGRSHFFFPWVGELFCSFSGSKVSRTAGARTFPGAPDIPN